MNILLSLTQDMKTLVPISEVYYKIFNTDVHTEYFTSEPGESHSKDFPDQYIHNSKISVHSQREIAKMRPLA
jgi:hypothetical protein